LGSLQVLSCRTWSVPTTSASGASIALSPWRLPSRRPAPGD